MTNRRVDVSIKSEFKRGFTDIANALKGLEKSLDKVASLQSSINKLNATFEKSNAYKNAANNVKQVAQAQTKLTDAQKQSNAAVKAGATLAAQYRSEQDKLVSKLGNLRAAQKQGSVSNQAALNAEIGLLKSYIKKTQDFAVVSRNLRGNDGKFATNIFSANALKKVQGDVVSSIFGGFRLAQQKIAQQPLNVTQTPAKFVRNTRSIIDGLFGLEGKSDITSKERKSLKNIYQSMFDEIAANEAQLKSRLANTRTTGPAPKTMSRINAMLGIGTNNDLSKTDRAQLTSFYRGVFDLVEQKDKELAAKVEAQRRAMASARQGAGLSVIDLINKNTGVSPKYDPKYEQLRAGYAKKDQAPIPHLQNFINSSMGISGSTDKDFQKLKDHYAKLDGVATQRAYHIRGLNFGPNARNTEGGFKRLFDQYNKLGHLLFQLQYSTYTIFGITGLGLIAAQADAYITLKNQVARTSESVMDLGENMKTVMDISKKTFSDPKSVGQLYSRINSYRDQLKLNQTDVGNITGAITGSFAASPGTAEAKAAAQYQLIQAIQSNRLGGDELRSIKEQAPFVADIITKYISKLRGLPAGQAADLSDKKNPVRTEELVKVFNDPNARKEIFDTLAKQGRTFGDMMVLAKIRMMELTQGFFESTGLIQKIMGGLSSLLSNDDKFAKFVQAIQFATTALLIFGATVVASKVRGAVTAGLAEGGALTKLGATAAAGRVRGVAAAQRIGGALTGVKNGLEAGVDRTLTKNVSGLGGAFLAMVNPINIVKNSVTGLRTVFASAGSFIGNFGKAIPGAFASLKNFNLKTIFAAMIRGIPALLSGLSGALGALGAVFGALGGWVTVLILAVAGLTLWFNKLLGQMTGGMNIMDIITGSWRMLMDAMKTVGDFISNTFIGQVVGAFMNMIEAILKFLGKAVADNPIFREEQLKRQYGLKEAKVYGQGDATVTGYGADGKLLTGTAKLRTNPAGDRVYDRDANENLIVYNNGKRAGVIIKGGDGKLPTGQQSQLAAPSNPAGPTGKSAAQKQADRFAEFLRDQYLSIYKAYETVDIPEGMLSAQEAYNESIRKAADIFDIQAAKFDANGLVVGVKDTGELIEEISKKVPERLKQALLNSAEELKNAELDKAFREFDKALTSQFNSLRFNAMKAGLSSFEGSSLDAKDELMTNTIDKGSFDLAKFNTFKLEKGLDPELNIQRYLTGLAFDQKDRGIRQFSEDSTLSTYSNQFEDIDTQLLNEQINSADRSAKLSQVQLNNQKELNKYFGRAKELRQAELDIEYKYKEQYGARLATTVELQNAMKEEIRLANERAAIEDTYRANWLNGGKAAVAEYLDSIKDVAGQTQAAFSNAFQGLEDLLVNFLNTGEGDWRGFVQSILNDAQRILVRQTIMKPLTEAIGGFLEGFGIDIGSDMEVQAKNVYVNGTPVGGATEGKNAIADFLGLNKEEGDSTTSTVESMKSWFSSFDGFIKNLQNGFKAVTNGFTKIIGDLVKAIMQVFQGQSGGSGDNSWLSAIGSVIGGIFGGGGSSGGSSGGGTITFGDVQHNGGTAGSYATSRMVSSSVFQNAKRYHTGVDKVGMNALASNEVPAILKMGEAVLTVPQQHAINRNMTGGGSNTSVFSPTVNISYTASGNNSSEEDAKQMGKMMKAAIQKELADYEIKRNKPGSLLSKR